MPPKPRKPAGKKNATTTSNSTSISASAESNTPLVCDGCTDSLPKNEALNCSVCNVWLHCYCAGVPRSRFSDIVQSYICIPCSLNSQSNIVSELKSEIACLKTEVVELKAALDLASKKLDAATNADVKTLNRNSAESGWSTVVKRGARQVLAKNGSASSRNAATKTHQNATDSERRAQSSNVRKNVAKVKVAGARRVWGTHWSSSPKAVTNTIRKFCGVTPDRVRRKCIKNDSGRVTRWWFVIHDSEEVLISIDSKWDQLKLQVAWELEPCFAPQEQLDSASSQTNAPESLDPKNGTQSQSQPDESLMSDVQTTLDNTDNNSNDADNNNPTPLQPEGADGQSFLEAQAPTPQNT